MSRAVAPASRIKVKELANGARGVGILRPVPRVADGLNDLHPIPVSIHFVRQNARQSGAAPVSHFRPVRNDVNRPIRLETKKHVRMKDSAIGGSVGHPGPPARRSG